MSKLTKYKRGRWMYSIGTLEAEEWFGCTKTIDELLTEAEEDIRHQKLPQDTPIFICQGIPLPKSECDAHGVDWPYYERDGKTAFKVVLNS